MRIQAAIQRKISEYLHPFLSDDGDVADESHATVTAGFSRRDLLFGGGIASTVLGAAGCPPLEEIEAPEENTLFGESDEKGGDPALRRLVERCNYGASEDDLKLAKQMGYDEYLDYQLDYNQIDDSELDDRLAGFQSLNYSARQFALAGEAGNWEIFQELINATILRAAYSKRQLYQRMVEFWTDHFNIYLEKDYMYYLKPVDDREVVRKHAMGKFPELLSASAHSPAMLVYLDNDPSSKLAPNQNYARELMELHALGVGNFTQKDVEEVARCFTGWSLEYDWDSPNWGKYKFYGWAHDKGKKKVLGVEIPKKGGAQDGQIVLDILSLNPNIAPICAQFISRKMANWLWGYNPPQQLVESMASSYLGSGGDIKKMIKTALSQEWLSQAPLKLKRPFHYVISSMRVVPSYVEEFWGIRYSLSLMGHEPFQWAPPNGYPDALAFWSGLLLPRWRYGSVAYTHNYSPKFILSRFEGEMDPLQFMNRLNKAFFGGKMSKTDRDLIYAYVNEKHFSEWRRKEALGLAISCSSFQWY
ncbi:MAG TPA: DUF1800 domain-containing protein [Candidatus Hydrogenedentes bacterium]|nr:DUF1800 domain-containing protein [Candidatus Hydrogenedentota bacterium]